MLFNLYEFECFWVFSLKLASSFKPLWYEKMLDMISIFFNLLRLILCPTMLSIFENFPCAFEKHVYFASLEWKFLYISSIKSILSRVSWCRPQSVGSVCCGCNEQIHMDCRSPVEKKGWHGHSLSERGPWPLPWQAFIAFLGTLHWGRSSLTMHRFTLGGYLLQKTKERMLLITSKKKDICKCKGKSGWTGYTCPWEV